MPKFKWPPAIIAENPSPIQPEKPDYQYTSSLKCFKTLGECNNGSYVEIYIPERPCYDGNGARKAVIYLHGFALGASQIYGKHIEHLVKQGYYVFYPNYHHGFCQFPSCQDHLCTTFKEIIKQLLKPYPISPERWIKAAIESTKEAYKQEGWFNPTVQIHTYLFGHSLGGLFALSWPYYATRQQICHNLLPKQIVVADPIPDAQSNIPPFILKFIKLLCGFSDNVDISITGAELNIPVAILHGNDDKIVPKETWCTPFQFIATQHKKMYISFTDEHGWPKMYANHQQATVDTSFVPDWLARNQKILDGVGKEDNFNWRYIWSALDRVIAGVRADQLEFDLGKWSDNRSVKSIKVFLPQDL